jgi:hypothetical protein
MNGIRRPGRLCVILGGACTTLVLAAPPLWAESADVLVRVERTAGQKTLSQSPNWVPISVIVVDRATGAPPAAAYNVVALATNTAGEKTEAFGCGQRSDNNVGVPRGIYDCVVIVDHGGSWTFQGVVNSVPVGNQPTVMLARGSVDINIEAGSLAGLAPRRGAIRARPREVVLLGLHSTFAGLWGLCVALLAAVALPGVRAVLSPTALHRLEDRLGLVTRLAGAATVLVVGTGLFLLLQQTAYKTPWSPSAAEGVFRLPYGRPYFLTLALKLGVYALMILAMVPLVVEARRRSHLASEPGGGAGAVPDDRRAASPWAVAAPASAAGRHAATATLEAPAPSRPAAAVAREHSGVPGFARGGAVVMVAGGATILACVTLLKYLHEFVEASRAVAR